MDFNDNLVAYIVDWNLDFEIYKNNIHIGLENYRTLIFFFKTNYYDVVLEEMSGEYKSLNQIKTYEEVIDLIKTYCI